MNNVSFLPNDIMILLIALTACITAIFMSQWHGKYNPKFIFYNRKILHIVVISLCGWIMQSINSSMLLGMIFLSAAFLLSLETYFNWLKVNKSESIGIPLFPLAFAIMLLMGFDHFVIAISAYILAFGDAVAGIIGKLFGKVYFTPFKEEKSLIGCSAFFIVTTIILSWQPWLELSLLAIIITGLLTTFAEMFSVRGSDNFSIILVACLCLSGFNGELI